MIESEKLLFYFIFGFFFGGGGLAIEDPMADITYLLIQNPFFSFPLA